MNLPYQPKVHHLVSEEQLELMKKEAFLINIARGPIWDEKALVEALKNHNIAGIATDVYKEEPFTNGKIYLQNLIMLF